MAICFSPFVQNAYAGPCDCDDEAAALAAATSAMDAAWENYLDLLDEAQNAALGLKQAKVTLGEGMRILQALLDLLNEYIANEISPPESLLSNIADATIAVHTAQQEVDAWATMLSEAKQAAVAALGEYASAVAAYLAALADYLLCLIGL